ncbi:MAG TPA: ABC transporter permease [Actinomycetota bacterium]|nr:ABC transporter permease [Actinomycetota bacterium]
MKKILLFAKLTIRESIRKKVVWVLAALTVLVLILSAIGLNRLVETGMAEASEGDIRGATSFILILIMFAYSFVLALSAVFFTVPAIAGEIETGTALAVLTRPVSRAQFLLGKWLGLVVLATVYVTVASLAEFAVVRLTTGYGPPHPLSFIAYMVAETVVILSLALLISTRMAPIAGGVIVLGGFMLAWMGGVAISLGRQFNVGALVTGGTVTRLLIPTDGMWKGAVYSLEPAALIAMARAQGADGIANFPFFSLTPPSPAYLAWTVSWVAGILALAIWSFRRREI